MVAAYYSTAAAVNAVHNDNMRSYFMLEGSFHSYQYDNFVLRLSAAFPEEIEQKYIASFYASFS
jgi:hypothetical protein